eukprot:gene11086-11241_t
MGQSYQTPAAHIKPHVAEQRLLAAASGNGRSSNLSKGPVLVVPAFYLDAAAFRPLVQELRAQGFNAALPPIRWTDWVPTLGGRSVRPILDRMDWALTQLLEGYQVTEEGGYEVSLPQPAGIDDWLAEFRDASQGARPSLQLTGPWQGQQRAALVASSAGGWISRIFLSRGPTAYCNAIFHGADRVHTLVTLGTPHTSAEPVTRRNIDFVNNHYGGCHAEDVRYVAIGSRTVQGKSWLGGAVQDFAWQSYNICCGDGSVWGDGVTPLECALVSEVERWSRAEADLGSLQQLLEDALLAAGEGVGDNFDHVAVNATMFVTTAAEVPRQLLNTVVPGTVQLQQFERKKSSAAFRSRLPRCL